MLNRRLLVRRSGVRVESIVGLGLAISLLAACGGGDAAPAPAVDDQPLPPVEEPAVLPSALILEPADGAELPAGDVRVLLSADHVAIVPAGDMTPNSGHHHLLLNVPSPPVGEPIPVDVPGHVHLGLAQSEYTFENLQPGEYTLEAVIGDFAHRVIPQQSQTVRFRVVPQD